MLLLNLNLNAKDGYPDDEYIEEYIEEVKDEDKKPQNDLSMISISVVGQGVAPAFASSPAQSYALAKRAATADAYRLIAEKIKGVRIEGKDTIKNMAIKSSTIKAKVSAMVRNATIVETTFKNGMCEVEMEIEIDSNSF